MYIAEVKYDIEFMIDSLLWELYIANFSLYSSLERTQTVDPFEIATIVIEHSSSDEAVAIARKFLKIHSNKPVLRLVTSDEEDQT